MASRAIQTGVRQSARKMRLVVDTIRGVDVNRAYATLQFSKKKAAKQIEKVLKSAVANAVNVDGSVDVDDLFVSYAVINEGKTLHRWRPAAFGRAVPIRKRTSSVEIHVAPREAK